MKLSRFFLPAILSCLNVFLDCCPLPAQFHAPLPRLEAESIQAQSRLEGLQRLVRPGLSIETLSLLLGSGHDSVPTALGASPTVQMLDEATWEDALNELDRLLQELGESLVPTPSSSATTLPPTLLALKLYVPQLVSGWPISIRDRYAKRAEKRGLPLVDRGIAARSEPMLRRVVNESPGSLAAQKAMVALGDLAFFKGRLHAALAWWTQVAPLPTVSLDLETERTGPARIKLQPLIQLKQVLAIAYLGDLEEARRQKAAFARLHPIATGTFAGIEGPYAKTLDMLLERFVQSGDTQLQDDWHTLGGNASRHLVVPKCPSPHLWVDGPTWKVSLPPAPKTTRPDGVFAKEGPLYHPLLAGQQVLLTDRQSVTAFDLLTGRQQFRHTFAEGESPHPSSEAPCYVGSIGHGLVVLRVGHPPERETHLKKPVERTWLAAVELAPTPDSGKRVRWKVSAPAEDPREAFFNGPPLYHDGRFWVPFEEWRGGSVFQGIASLNPETGRWLSRTLLGKLPPLPPGRDTMHQPVLLAGAGNQVIACTQAGSTVAVDSQTGKVTWAVRYPSQGPWTRLTTPSSRDLAAPVVSLNRVYVAPQDSDLLLCLDASTGEVIWERQILDVVQILGRSRGKLAFTTSTGLRTLSADTGSDRDGWMAPSVGRVPPRGRGLILGDWIFWPTHEKATPMLVLSLEEGRPETGHTPTWDRPRPLYFSPAMLRHLPAGNLAYGQGSLVIATERELVAFARPGHLLELRKKEEKKTPVSTLLLAQSEADAGQTNAGYARLRDLGKERAKGWQDLAGERLHEMLVERILDLEAREQNVVVQSLLLEAQDNSFKPWQRAWALHRLGLHFERLGETDRKQQAFNKLKSEDELMEALQRRTMLTPTTTALEGEKKSEKKTEPQEWTVPLQSVHTFTDATLTLGDPKLRGRPATELIVQKAREVHCYDTGPIRLRWRESWPSMLHWAEVINGSLLLAGPDEIRWVSLASGKSFWTFRNPARLLDRWELEGDNPSFTRSSETFANFRLEKGNLVLSWGIQEFRLKPDEPFPWQASLRWGPTEEEPCVCRYTVEGDTVRAMKPHAATPLWEVQLPVASQEWTVLEWAGHVLVHPSGNARVRAGGLEFFPALALAWQWNNPIARDDADFFLLDSVRGRLLQRITLQRGPGPYCAQLLAGGLALGNGREVSVFLSQR